MSKKEEVIKAFYKIAKRGWISTHRHGDRAIGNAFEDILGLTENNFREADFHGIEFKAQRASSTALMTLFTKSPTYPRGVNSVLRELYGVEDEERDSKKILHTTISGYRENTHRGGFGYKARVDKKEELVHLEIRDLNTNKLEDLEVYWSFNDIAKALEKKLKTIAILHGDEKVENGQRYVRFTKMNIITGLTLEKMIKALEKGDLYIDIRIGVYGSGKNIGKTHDHGTGFRMYLENLLTYGKVETYEYTKTADSDLDI